MIWSLPAVSHVLLVREAPQPHKGGDGGGSQDLLSKLFSFLSPFFMGNHSEEFDLGGQFTPINLPTCHGSVALHQVLCLLHCCQPLQHPA